MRATKGNKEYMIDGSQQKRYQDAGFDILNELGEVVAYGRGKTVPYDEHMRAITRLKCCGRGLQISNLPRILRHPKKCTT